MNSATVVGNIVRDLEVNDGGGTPVVNGTVAEDHGYGTNFIPFVVWGERAETVAEHLGKGDGIILSGAFEEDRYTDSDGNDRSQLQLNVSNFSFPPGGNGGNESSDSADYEDDAPF